MTRRVSRLPLEPPRYIVGPSTARAGYLVGASDRCAPRSWSTVDVPDPRQYVASPTATEIHRRLFSGWAPPSGEAPRVTLSHYSERASAAVIPTVVRGQTTK